MNRIRIILLSSSFIIIFFLGLFIGISLFIITWRIILFDGSSADPTFIGKIYRGYSLTPYGSLIGLLWGLIDGAITGAVFAWVYNKVHDTFQ